MRIYTAAFWALILSVLLSGCGGGGGGTSAPTPPAWHNVTLSWIANHETGVNSIGGGYIVSINGQSAPAPTNILYVSGLAAPTSTTVSLYTGTYSATVTAFASLDSSGGTTGTSSTPSTTLSINVP